MWPVPISAAAYASSARKPAVQEKTVQKGWASAQALTRTEQPRNLPMSEHEEVYPPATRDMTEERNRLAPGPAESFRAFSKSVFADGAVPARTKQLIAVAVAHVTQYPYCIRGHTRAALRQGATPEEIMEVIWVAAEMRAGGAYAHSAVALDEIARHQGEKEANP